MKRKTAAGGLLPASADAPLLLSVPDQPPEPAALTIAITEVALEEPSYDTMTLDDALDELAVVDDYIERWLSKINAAHKARQDLRAVINARLTANKCRKYAGVRMICRYDTVKSGGASIPLPDSLRADLLAAKTKISDDDLANAVPVIQPPPTCKPDLRAVRKLSEYGEDIAAIVKRHIREANKTDVLIIEPIMLTVEPAKAALG
jgi:hypothetical protein